MMRQTIFVLLALLGAIQAFSVSKPSSVRRPDTSTAVEEAMKITAAFGIDSSEAKVAWDSVEEMDASDNRCVCVCLAHSDGQSYISLYITVVRTSHVTLYLMLSPI